MKLKRFKKRDNKRIGIIVFTVVCILLVSVAVLYRTFAIFEVKTNQNVINGSVQSMGDLEFAFYKDVDGKDTIVKEVPTKDEGYSLDTSSSYCVDLLNNQKVSNVNWDNERWGPYLSNITTTKTKCYLHFKQIYQEEELHGAIPDLGNGRLVPVQILNNDKPTDIKYDGAVGGKVVKADITSNWYSYKDKQWANAVILRDGKSDDYEPGQEILESDIESYFVWIPRYSYKLQDDESVFNSYQTATDLGKQSDVSSVYNAMTDGNKAINHGFEITFETKDKGVKRGTSKGNEITHPAFVDFDSNGFWVGKFETGYNQNVSNIDVTPNDNWSTKGAQQNEDNSEKIIIKPNVYSWREIQVANAFYTSYNYQRDLESHMLKNLEWGAVAYLTQSKYGRCNENNQNCTKIRINNNNSYITGYSALQEPTCGYTGTVEQCNWYGGPSDLSVLDSEDIKSYYSTESQESSTTGNYSGVYDMSGGAWEFVMGVMQVKANDATPTSGRNHLSNSGFKGPYSCPECENQSILNNENGKPWPSSKYYDLYDYNTLNQEYQRGKLGDATKEFGPFFQIAYLKANGSAGPVRLVGNYNASSAFFVTNNSPWFARGGNSATGSDAGFSAFLSHYGRPGDNSGFRIVLAP